MALHERTCAGQVWRPQLGAVDLSLTVGGTTLDLVVTPLQATLLLQFKVRAPARCFSNVCMDLRMPVDLSLFLSYKKV